MLKPIRHNLHWQTSRTQGLMARKKGEMNEAERIAVTGLKVTRASDDPSRWPEINAIQSSIEDQRTYQANLDRSDAFLITADKTLGFSTDLLSRARERAVQLTNEIYTSTDRAAASNELFKLKEQLIGVANTEVNGRFLFAGNAYDNPAFDDAGVYLGASTVPLTRMSETSDLQTGWDGEQVFQGTVDIFQVLEDIGTAMAANDVVGIRDQLVALDLGLEQVVAWRTEIGFKQVAANDALSIAETMEQILVARKDEATEEDPAAAYTKLAEMRLSYEATLQVAAATSKTKLFDFIR